MLVGRDNLSLTNSVLPLPPRKHQWICLDTPCFLLISAFTCSCLIEVDIKVPFLQNKLDELIGGIGWTGTIFINVVKITLAHSTWQSWSLSYVTVQSCWVLKRSAFLLCEPCWPIFKDHTSQCEQPWVLSIQLSQGFIDPELELYEDWLSLGLQSSESPFSPTWGFDFKSVWEMTWLAWIILGFNAKIEWNMQWLTHPTVVKLLVT